MPDLDKLFDTLVADVTAGTCAPGAATAVKQAQRRRATVAIAGVGLVSAIAVSAAVTFGSLDGRTTSAPVGEPTASATSAPDEPTAWETAGSHAALYDLGQELDAILTSAPGWAMVEGFPEGYDYAFNGPCAGSWTRHASSGSDGGAPRPAPVGAGIGTAGFTTASRAADAAATFVGNLESCEATTWRTRPIAQTGAVLASSDTGVAWISQTGRYVRVLQVPSTDGPPPLDVQVGVADWMVAYDTWQEQAREQR